MARKRTGKKRGRAKKPKVREQDVQGTKYLTRFMDVLRPLHSHRDDPKRKLHYDELVAFLLLYFFTPVLDSVRGLQHASDFPKLKRKLKLGRFSLGSWSESIRVFDPEPLVGIIEGLPGRLSRPRRTSVCRPCLLHRRWWTAHCCMRSPR